MSFEQRIPLSIQTINDVLYLVLHEPYLRLLLGLVVLHKKISNPFLLYHILYFYIKKGIDTILIFSIPFKLYWIFYKYFSNQFTNTIIHSNTFKYFSIFLSYPYILFYYLMIEILKILEYNNTIKNNFSLTNHANSVHPYDKHLLVQIVLILNYNIFLLNNPQNFLNHIFII